MSGWNPKIYNRGAARAFFIKREPTMNPTPAAAYLLGMTVDSPKYHRVGEARRNLLGKRHPRTGNPIPAVLGLLGGKLGQRLKGSPRYDGGPLMTTVQAFLERVQKGGADGLAAVGQLHREATNVTGKHRMQWAKVWNVELPALGGALKPQIRAEIKRLDPTTLVAGGRAEGEAAAREPVSALERAAAGLAPVVIRETVRQGRQPRARYENFIDPVTGVLRRRKVRGASVRSFGGGGGGGVRAASGLGKAALGAGVAIGGLAAGYWVGSKLNTYLAGRALSKEQAGVAAAQAFREARQDAADAKGAPLTAAEVRSMGTQYKAQLIELGYDPVTFTRRRSAIESFFTGQEE